MNTYAVAVIVTLFLTELKCDSRTFGRRRDGITL